MDPRNPPDGSVPPRWGLLDVATALVVAYFGSVLASLALAAGGGWQTSSEVPGWALFLAQIPFWAGMAGVPLLATRNKGNGPVADLGLSVRWIDLPVGVAAGALTQLAVLPIVYFPLRRWIDTEDIERPAKELVARFGGVGGRTLFVVMVCVAAPLAEELLYRGLLLRSLGRLWARVPAIGVTAVVFGLMHFQAVQTLGLVVFGAVAGVLATRTGRLGPAIVAHAAFNAVTAVTLLAG